MKINSQAKTISLDGPSERAILIRELETFMKYHPNFLNCRENMRIMSDYLAARELPPMYPNLKKAYEELLEAGMLHITPPEGKQVGAIDSRLPKVKIEKYSGSHYDRTQINRLKANLAAMDAQQHREFMEVNGWSDYPLWLRT
jgi:hypothetical protein